MLMMINCSAMFVSVFTSISMKIDNFQNAMLGNYSLVGYVIGAILCMILSAFKVPFKYIFAFGFSFITAYAIYMYFQYQSMGLYEHDMGHDTALDRYDDTLYHVCRIG